MRHPKQLYTKKCVICNTEFSYTQYFSIEKKENRSTCSRKCMYALTSRRLSGRFIPNGKNEKDWAKRKTTKCKWCKKKIIHLKSAPRTFCSRICKANFQKTLLGRKNPCWKPANLKSPYRFVKKAVRRDLIEERKFCEVCNTDKLLQVHHKDRNRGNNLHENLKLLCQEHHAQEHEINGEHEIARLIRVHPNKRIE